MKKAGLLAIISLACGSGASPRAATPTATPSRIAATAIPPSSYVFSSATPDHAWQDPAEGGYRLSLTADDGSRKGRHSVGHLELRSAGSNDKSPRTGETAVSEPRLGLLAWGWTDTNLGDVGAPMCQDNLHPRPTSRDPVYPGVVLLATSSLAPPSGDNRPMLLVGTLANLRNGRMYTDGCGIMMSIKSREGRCFHGSWAGFGLRHDGTGTFTLCPEV